MVTFLIRLALVTLAALVLISCGAQSTKQQSSSAGTPSNKSASSPASSPASSGSNSPSTSSPTVGSPGAPSSPSGGTIGGSTSPSSGSQSTTANTSGAGSPAESGPNSRSSGNSGSEQASAPYADGSETSEQQNAPTADESMSDTDDIDLSETETSSSASASNSQNRSSQPSASGPQATSDRIEQLESAFEGSISTYDGIILREREYIANRNNAKGSEEQLEEEVSGPLFDEIGNGEESPASSGGPGPAYEPGPGGTGNLPPSPSNGRQGEYAHSGGAVPEDIPNGNDDDVVARQIREAALNESDPELREKLWQEYRRYKNAQ